MDNRDNLDNISNANNLNNANNNNNINHHHNMKKKIFIILAIIVAVVIAGAGYLLWASRTSNPWGAKTIADIPVPIGYERAEVAEGSYAAFLRSLPLKKRGSRVHLFTGGEANYQWLSAGVIDLPLLSNYEQCADMTMRLRAEYLWQTGQYSKIRFTDVNGERHRYEGGASRKAFERFMKRMYGICSTFSVYRETEQRDPSDIEAGDVLVYPARKGHKLGHAILIVDVATNAHGDKAIICVEGNTPAREAHVVRNLNPLRNPWSFIGREDSNFPVSVFHFERDNLRHY